MEEEGFDSDALYDKGHLKIALQRRFDAMVKKHSSRGKNPFFGIKSKILNYSEWLIDNVDDPEEKMELWKNVPEHFCGNHEHCRHPEDFPHPGRPSLASKNRESKFTIWKNGISDKTAKSALENYCSITAPLIANCCKDKTTQSNESQNSIISRYASKNINYT